jgi:multidrug efflux system membrane fusion protein
MKYWPWFILPLLVACGESVSPSAQTHAPRLVKTLEVAPLAEVSALRYSGEVRARFETPLAFRVGGKITERLVDAGAHVVAGQPLARLDATDLRLAAEQAEANRQLAEAELMRARALREKNFISQAALDAKESVARQAEAQARLAKNQIGYATLTADHDGVIAAALAEAGQVVAAGQAVFRVARDGEREVLINLPEAHLAQLKVGARGTARLWSEAQAVARSYPAVLREIAPAADPASRTFAARVTLIDAPRDLPLGLSATVSFPLDQEASLVVPLAALVQQGERPAVWVVAADDTVTLRPVTIARYSDAGALVTAGLMPGETIVAAGASLLSAGEKIRRVRP